MKSSLCSDEIFGVPPQMKLNPPRPSPREAGFHREAISSTKGGFLPPAADLTEKSRLLSQSAFFLGRGRRIRTRDPRFWRPVLYQLSYTPIVDFVNTSYYITLFVGLQAFFEKKFLSSKKSLFGRFFRCGWFAVSAFWGA